MVRLGPGRGDGALVGLGATEDIQEIFWNGLADDVVE
jgi:hypothetical protein